MTENQESNPSAPLLILKRQDAATNLSVFAVDVNYTNQFCQRLADKKISFRRSARVTAESGFDGIRNPWTISTNEVQVDQIQEILKTLRNWHLPLTAPARL